ncbi:MAG: STAS domain-containing protein [Proteobacteria bacterium]|nr:STAS domain-containing protein [Pseudomonadota bacterium]
MKKTTVELINNEMVISGDLTQGTIMSLLERALGLLPSESTLNINLQAVERCDSASVAFLTTLMRESRLRRTVIQFYNLPKQMLQISRVCGLENVLPVAEL